MRKRNDDVSDLVARLSGKPQIYMDEEIKGQMNIFDFGA